MIKDTNRGYLNCFRSRIPTPAPRNYFPVSGDDDYEDVTKYNDISDDYFYNSNKIDEIDSSSGITTFSYNNDNRFGGMTVATGGYYDAYVTSPPPPPSIWTTERPEADLTTASYFNEDDFNKDDFNEDDIWAGYSKVVQDLLRDRQYPRPPVVNTDIRQGYLQRISELFLAQTGQSCCPTCEQQTKPSKKLTDHFLSCVTSSMLHAQLLSLIILNMKLQFSKVSSDILYNYPWHQGLW